MKARNKGLQREKNNSRRVQTARWAFKACWRHVSKKQIKQFSMLSADIDDTQTRGVFACYQADREISRKKALDIVTC